MFKHTLAQVREIHLAALKALIEEAGNANHLSKMINVPVATVRSWIERGRISKNGAELVAAHPELGAKFPMSKLRPEL